MEALIFHKDVFIPDFAKVPLFEGKLRFSGGRDSHADHVTREGGGYEGIPLPANFIAKNATLIEAYINPQTGEVEKQVWRQKLDDKRDICFPMLRGGFVKTVWLNDRTDTHSTLRRERYVGGFQWRNMKNKLGKKNAS